VGEGGAVITSLTDGMPKIYNLAQSEFEQNKPSETIVDAIEETREYIIGL